MSQFKRFNTSDNSNRSDTTIVYPAGTLTWDDANGLRLHDGSTVGGNSIGGGGGVGSFGTDKGIGADYASNNPAILFSDDDMIIRTGGTAGHGTIGAMYIASAEELIIGHTDASLTDATSLGAGNFTDYLQIDTNGIEMTTARGTVQFGYNLEAPGVPTHFHINKLDQSFDLFFGDDSNYFHLPAGGGSPVIGANDGSSGQKLWTFGADGKLTVPGTITGPGGQGGNTVIQAPLSNQVVIENNAGYNVVTVQDQDVRIVTSPDYGTTFNTWTFGNTGTLTLPRNNKITSANTPQVGIRITGIETAIASFGTERGDPETTYQIWDASATNFVNQVWNPYCVGNPDALVGYFILDSFGAQVATIVGANANGPSYSLETDNYGIGAGPYTFQSPDYVAASANDVHIEVGGHNWNFGANGITSLSKGINVSDNLTLQVSGIPNAVTGLTGVPIGGWSGSYTNLSTTGGSGTGLTVNASESGSGYIDTVTINTPGHGYTDGDTITITSGEATAFFTISILSAKSWTFDGHGNITFPDSTVQTTAWTGTVAYSNVSGTPNLSVYATQSTVSTLQITVNNLTNTLSTLTTTATVNSLIANSLTNYATQSYVTTRGYLTTVTSVAQATSASIVTTAAQPNITSVGTLTSLSVSGNVTANKFVGDGSSLTNVTVNVAGSILGTGTNVTLVAGSYSYLFDNTGTLTMPANGDIVMTGTNATITAGGSITAGYNSPSGGTAFIAGNAAVNNIALGYQPTSGAANMAIRDLSTVTTIMYFDAGSNTTSTNSQFLFRSSSAYTTWAKIDQYGVNQPTRPAFRVYGAGTTTNLTTTANTNGILNSNNFAVDYQQGTALTTSTGIFTAPVAGLYSVHLVARVSNTSSAQIAVVKNYASSGPVQAMWECGANCTANHFGVSSIVKLAAGDTLVIKVLLGQINFDSNDSWAVAYIG